MTRSRLVTTLVPALLAAGIWAQVRTVSVSGAPQAGHTVLPFKATEQTLPNGLKVIVVPTGFPNLVSIQIPVQTGSRNEVEPGRSGFAHFFEHLMFRGTPTLSPDRFTQIMEKAGARENATTGDDVTRFFATFSRDDLDTMLATYADMFQHLAYSEADFKTEARAILGEYNKNSAEPVLKINEVQRAAFFKVHPYRHTTMGFIDDIENMPNEYAYSKVFFDRWYRPQYTTLIVAGDVTAAQVMPLVEKYWGGWASGTGAPVVIPQEPAPAGPYYAHVPWTAGTLPWVSVGYLGPAFDEQSADTAAMDVIAALAFGPTSPLYTRLVTDEQKVDVLMADTPMRVDPSLFTVYARVKKPADTVYVRDQILAAFADARTREVSAARLADAQSFDRYGLARSLDSTESIATTLAGFARYRRSYDTINHFFQAVQSLTPADLQAVARKYFLESRLIVTTLSQDPLPAAIRTLPSAAAASSAAVASPAPAPPVTPIATAADAGAGADIPIVRQASPLPQLDLKLLFTVGSAHDPAGKEGLAALTAAMIADGGSTHLTSSQIQTALYPMAASFSAAVDKEMTTFTASVHEDNWPRFLAIVLPQMLEPGFRDEDFSRLRDAQINALTQDLRANNEEELGKERLQTNIFRGTPYAHVALGTVAGLHAITLDDVRAFARQMYTRANLTIGINGHAPDAMIRTVQASLGRLPEGPAVPRRPVHVARAPGIHVEIVEKDTRATAISIGFPIDVRRGTPDFPALSVARAWLGEHRAPSGRLFQRIRGVRGMNYGDYAYIEAFPDGMFQFFPDPNLARQQQIFEIWIRPVVPVNAHMALRIAVSELRSLIANGLTPAAFERTRDYLMKNVFVMTARQDQQLGYALDSRWYGIGEFTTYMRDALRSLTVEEVNAAIRKDLTGTDLSVVAITKDAAALKQALASDAFSPIHYDGEKPQALLDEDRVVGALKLGIAPADIRITPVDEVFAQ
jgi:zinc protease